MFILQLGYWNTFFFKSNRGQLNTKHKENVGEFGALICLSPLIYSRLGYLLIHTIWIFHYLPIQKVGASIFNSYSFLLPVIIKILILSALCSWLKSSNITTHDMPIFFFASNFLNFISLSPRLNSTNKFERHSACRTFIVTNRPTAWRTLFLPIGLRPDERYCYQSAYGLTNLIFTNRSTACPTLFLPIPGYYLT